MLLLYKYHLFERSIIQTASSRKWK